jgi:hypothetical protein
MGAVIAVAVSACGSGGSGGEVSSSAPSSAGVSSMPVPPGVPKDSVLDLNSTKDMTGVVTTVPIGQSPYDENMPDLCAFLPQSALDLVGMVAKKKSFYGPKLITQSCQLTPAPSESGGAGIDFTAYVNNIGEYLANPDIAKIDEIVLMEPAVRATVVRARGTDFTEGAWGCGVVWGTFFGTASISILDFDTDKDICLRAVVAARKLAPFMPKSPSEMRPTS